MNRIKGLFLLAISMLATQLHAQQDVQFTQYMHNRIFFNPGMAGNSDAISLNFGHRTQWVGFDNAPVTQNINAELPVDKLHGGVMLNITNDQIGFFQDISAALGYAYQTYVGPGKLGIGLSVDFRNKNVRNAQWIFPDGGAGSNDPAVMNAFRIIPHRRFFAKFPHGLELQCRGARQNLRWFGFARQRRSLLNGRLPSNAVPPGELQLRHQHIAPTCLQRGIARDLCELPIHY